MRKLFLILSALVALVVAGPALAAKIKSGTSTVTLSDAASSALTTQGITATPIAPASSAAAGTFTFPIARGRINKENHGYLLHQGGITLTKGDKSVSLRHPLIVVRKKGGVLAVATHRQCHRAHRAGRHHRGLVVVCRVRFRAVARLSDITVSGNTGTATLTLTKYAANQLNKLAGTDFAQAGQVLGTVKVVVSDSTAPVGPAPPVMP